MPRAAEPAIVVALVTLDTAFAQRPPLVWAGVVERTDLAAMTGQCDALCPGLHRTNFTFVQLIDFRNLVPNLLRALLRFEVVLGN